jgi:hypothetical protein
MEALYEMFRMRTFGVGKVHFADILAGTRARLHLETALPVAVDSL